MAAAADIWKDEAAVESMSAADREKIVADWVRAKCADRTTQFETADVTEMVRIYGMKALFRLLDEGLHSDVGRKAVLTNRAYSCMHTAGMRSAQADEINGEELYKYHGDQLRAYLTGTVLPALNKLTGPPLLREFKRRWENHKIFTEWMRKMFRYLDRRGAYVGNFQQSSLTSKGIQLFKEVVFDGKKGDLVDTIQTIANQEREGEQIDRALLKSVIELFLVMGISSVRDFKDMADVKARAKDESAGTSSTYRDDFEVHFLRNTTDYYAAKAVEWFATDSAPEYLAKCETALEADRERVLAYLNPVTEPKLVAVIRDVLVKDRIEDLLNKEGSGARELLRDDRTVDLGRMFRMFSLVTGGLKSFGLVFRAYLKERGAALVSKRKDESEARVTAGKPPGQLDVPFTEDLLGLYDHYNGVTTGVFEGHAVFQEEFKNAWTHIMNMPTGPVSIAELLAAYMDSVLRDSKLSEEGQAAKTGNCARLTEYLDEKDVFQLFYEKLLSDRLLNDETTSNDVEKGVITMFKQARGAAFTTKMEGMVTDLLSSESNVKKFQARYQEWAASEAAAGRTRILFDPVVLCAGHWPQFMDLPGLHPPAEFMGVAKVFTEFYEEANGSRQIGWVWSRGKAEVFGFFKDKAGNEDRKTLKMSLLQALVCIKFNEQETYSAGTLAEELGLAPPVVDSLVKPMLSRMKKPAKKGDKPKKIPGPFKMKKDAAGKPTIFAYNEKYTNPRREVEMQLPNLATTKAQDQKRVDKGREYQLDAAIVRIMKTRQTLKHQDLVMEVSKAIRLFVPQPAQIKKRIDQLISKDYLERDEDDRTTYNYLA